MAGQTLNGRRVLVVEDEALVAMLIETALEGENCIIRGPYARPWEALDAAHSTDADAALLDVNLAGEHVFPVAEVLERRGIPFLLLSGYGDLALPPEKQHWPICGKPFKMDELVAALEKLLAGSTAAS